MGSSSSSSLESADSPEKKTGLMSLFKWHFMIGHIIKPLRLGLMTRGSYLPSLCFFPLYMYLMYKTEILARTEHCNDMSSTLNEIDNIVLL